MQSYSFPHSFSLENDMREKDLKSNIESNVLKGKEVTYEIEYSNLGKYVLDKLEKNPDFIGEVDAITEEKYTYERMRDRSVGCALWMKSQGIKTGDFISICSHNQLDIAMPCFAASYIGAIFVPLDPTLNTKDLLHIMNIVKIKMIFVNEESVSMITKVDKILKLDMKIIVFGRANGLLNFDNVIAESGVDEIKKFYYTSNQTLDDIAIVVCSSGTTGLPKGVALSHGAILRQIYISDPLNMSGQICLLFSSVYWITGILCMFLHLHFNNTRIVPPPFEEYSACAIAEKFKITWILLGSTMVTRLLKSDALKKYDLSSLRYILHGGSSLASNSREAFAKLFPNADMLCGYGMTEAGGLVSIQSKNSNFGSCGKLVNNVQLKVIDPNTGQTLGANQKGEIMVKTASLMNCYYNNPKATGETFDKEGWLHSGDLGYYDDNEEIFIIERLKELIKYRGSQICPAEIETVILSHPGIEEVAVVGQPHPQDGEHPIAFAVRKTDSSGNEMKVTEEELLNLVAQELSINKQLRGGVKFIESLPKSPSDKIRKKKLRDLAKSMIQL